MPTLTPRAGLLVSLVLVSGVLLGACSWPSLPTGQSDTATEKSGDTVKTGVVMELQGRYFLNQPESSQPEEIDSYNIDFAPHIGKRVKVTGQYSGNTLFISEVESAQVEPQSTPALLPLSQ